MARKLCTICNKRPVGMGKNSGYEDQEFCLKQGFCNPCGNEGQHEIAHDNGHEYIPMSECWLCNPEMNEAAEEYTPRKGHTNTVAKSRESHAGCTHPRTPLARARCRKVRAEHGSPVATDLRGEIVKVCTCGGNPETDGKVLIHSHKCPLKGEENVIVHNKDVTSDYQCSGCQRRVEPVTEYSECCSEPLEYVG